MIRTSILFLTIAVCLPTSLEAQRKKAKPDKPVAAASGLLKGKITVAKLKKPLKLKIGKALKGKVELRLTDFFGAPAVATQFDMANRTKGKLEISCCIAFFDKKGDLLTCSTPSATFGPGEKMPIGSNVATMTKDDAKKLASYQLRWLEAAKK